jgi:hypothetical protein
LVIRGAALVAVAFVAACGGGGSDGDGDPAALAPANALVYVEAVVRPEGSQRDDALEALGKVLRTDDPEARIRELLQGEVDYERDVQPWLGERAGFWAGSEGDQGVAVLAATDTDAAREALERRLQAHGQTLTERSHRGVDYVVNSDGVGAAVIDEFAAVGREADLKRTIDASEGDSLAESDTYTDAVKVLEDDRLATFWVDMRGALELAMRSDPELEQLRAVVPLDDLPALVGGFAANGERLSLETTARGGRDLGLGSLFAGGGTPLLQELPGDTWAAFGVADLGERVRDAIEQAGGAIGGVTIRGQVRRQTGLDLDRDLLDWIGHSAVFVRGTTPDAVDGGLVIQPTDEGKAADAFGRILGAIQRARGAPARPVEIAGADQAFALRDPGSARPLVFARGSGLVVVSYGEAAAEAALGSGDRLGEGEVYEEAEELVGMEPSMLLSMPAVLELADASSVPSDSDFGRARPYLEAFSVFAAGAVADGDTVIARLGAGLR